VTDINKGDTVTPRTDDGRRYSHSGEIGKVLETRGVTTTVIWGDGDIQKDWHEGNLVKVTGNYYKPKTTIVQAEQLRWDNWGPVCEMLGDLMGPDKIRGVAITDKNVVRETPDDEASHIGLWIPAQPNAYIASENDYIVKDLAGHVTIVKAAIFDSIYEGAV